MGLWLSAANTWAGAARGFWTAEMHRQHKTMLNEMTKPKRWSGIRSRSSRKASAGVQRESKG